MLPRVAGGADPLQALAGKHYFEIKNAWSKVMNADRFDVTART